MERTIDEVAFYYGIPATEQKQVREELKMNLKKDDAPGKGTKYFYTRQQLVDLVVASGRIVIEDNDTIKIYRLSKTFNKIYQR